MDRVVVETCWFEFWSGSAFWGKFLSCLPARDQQNQWGASRASLSRQLIFVEPPTNNLRRRRKKDGVVFPSTSRCLNGGMPKRRSYVQTKESVRGFWDHRNKLKRVSCFRVPAPFFELKFDSRSISPSNVLLFMRDQQTRQIQTKALFVCSISKYLLSGLLDG